MVAAARNPHLPHLALRNGSPAIRPAELARQVHAAVGRSTAPPSLLELAGWELRVAELSADVGGQDALLIPTSAGSFQIVVDPRLSARQYWWSPDRPSRTLIDSVIAFRIAHEIGHTFFYAPGTPGSPPRRRTPLTPQEEDFCDLFAAALVVQDDAAPDASYIAEVARRHGGNIELAALWAASSSHVTVDIVTDQGSQRFGRHHRRKARVTSAVAGQVEVRVAA